MKKPRSFAIESAGWRVFILRISGLIALLAFLNPGGARARSWSYHYQPSTPQPSPAAAPTMAAAAVTEQTPTALLLKRAIISDLAVLVRQRNVPSERERTDDLKYAVNQLLRFDLMDSPQALGVFVGLSGYYLGARAEQVYRCLTLRKGKTIEPLLAEGAGSGNLECARELGQEFASPSSALDGRALCRSRQDQTAFLAGLIAEIDSGRACPNDELAALVR